MKRKIIRIDEGKCTGCGLCAAACHEGAIGIIGGKAKLLREDYCDGMGDCLPECPADAISFEEREAAAYDENAVMTNKQTKQQWPIQIQLVPVTAPYFDGADLLVAADCTAYTYVAFYQEFIMGRVTLIGCPKLDVVDYSEKLTEILENNDIKSITMVRMIVPCCGGLEMAVKNAIQNSGKSIPCRVVTVSTDGTLLQ